jgi:hypothetical protein
MRLATPLLIVALIACLAGCGGSSEETTAPSPAPAMGGGAAKQKVQAAFEGEPGCERPRGASRWGCSVDSYRCQGVVTDRGWSVSCAKPGRSIAFRIPRG